MALEFARDEAFLRADEMQHLDDLPVGRHRAARREHHRQHRGGDHQREDRQARPRRRCAPSRACGRPSRDDRRASRPAPSASCLRSAARSGVSPGADAHHDQARHRQFVERRARCRATARAGARILPCCRAARPRCPASRDASAAARRTSASMSRCSDGRIWIVTSRATADCQSPAAERTSTTAPSVSVARNVMIAITASSARPEIEFGRHDRGFAARAATLLRGRAPAPAALLLVIFGLRRHAVLTRRPAAGRHAAPAAARRSGPSARYRGSRSRPRCRTC